MHVGHFDSGTNHWATGDVLFHRDCGLGKFGGSAQMRNHFSNVFNWFDHGINRRESKWLLERMSN